MWHGDSDAPRIVEALTRIAANGEPSSAAYRCVFHVKRLHRRASPLHPAFAVRWTRQRRTPRMVEALRYAPMHQCTNAPMHQCTNAPMHQCTNAPMHPESLRYSAPSRFVVRRTTLRCIAQSLAYERLRPRCRVRRCEALRCAAPRAFAPALAALHLLRCTMVGAPPAASRRLPPYARWDPSEPKGGPFRRATHLEPYAPIRGITIPT
jgi:hypothetical protein